MYCFSLCLEFILGYISQNIFPCFLTPEAQKQLLSATLPRRGNPITATWLKLLLLHNTLDLRNELFQHIHSPNSNQRAKAHVQKPSILLPYPIFFLFINLFSQIQEFFSLQLVFNFPLWGMVKQTWYSGPQLFCDCRHLKPCVFILAISFYDLCLPACHACVSSHP